LVIVSLQAWGGLSGARGIRELCHKHLITTNQGSRSSLHIQRKRISNFFFPPPYFLAFWSICLSISKSMQCSLMEDKKNDSDNRKEATIVHRLVDLCYVSGSCEISLNILCQRICYCYLANIKCACSVKIYLCDSRNAQSHNFKIFFRKSLNIISSSSWGL